MTIEDKFQKYGFNKVVSNDDMIVYKNILDSYSLEIIFNLKQQFYLVRKVYDLQVVESVVAISIELHNTITEQMKIIGWLKS